MEITPENLPVLDRLVQFDERSRAFRAVEGIEDRPFRSYTWSCDVYHDQGREGACVGYAWTHELAARPKVVRRPREFAQQIYRRAQQIDYWPGEDYEGTSVIAGVKAIGEIKNSNGAPLVSEYRWAFGIQDVVKTIGYKGPLVLGIEWHYNMYFPGTNGFIEPTGGVVGGHAILAKGVKVVEKETDFTYGTIDWNNVDLDKSYVRLHNSWGTSYGKGGDAFITLRNLDTLLQADGEACIPTKRAFDR